MNWTDLATENLRAARHLTTDHPRASVTRSYYAAYCSVTAQLYQRGITQFAHGWNNPKHEKIGDFVQNNLGLTHTDATSLRALIASLRLYRENADYRPWETIEKADAAAAIRDAELVLSAFGTPIL
jgi:uncharacterized protein (UPF0332 family)